VHLSRTSARETPSRAQASTRGPNSRRTYATSSSSRGIGGPVGTPSGCMEEKQHVSIHVSCSHDSRTSCRECGAGPGGADTDPDSGPATPRASDRCRSRRSHRIHATQRLEPPSRPQDPGTSERRPSWAPSEISTSERLGRAARRGNHCHLRHREPTPSDQFTASRGSNLLRPPGGASWCDGS
jgi:hypothetical protein